MKWRINFKIDPVHLGMFVYIPQACFAAIPKKEEKQILDDWVIEYSNGTLTAFLPVPAIEAVVAWIKDKLVGDPAWADEMHKKVIVLNREYFDYAKSLEGRDFGKESNESLWNLYKTMKDYQRHGHTDAISTTWFMDSDGEVFSNHLRESLRKQMEKIGQFDPVKHIEYFTLLTSPFQSNFAQEEQLDFLELLKLVEHDGVEKSMPAINIHYKKWRWMAYDYVGPAYDLNHYLDQLKETLGTIEDIDSVMAEEKYGSHAIPLE